MNAVTANSSWLTSERLKLARESAAWNEDQGRPGTALTINVLVAEVEALREAAKGSAVIVNQAVADKGVALLKASTLCIVAEKIAPVLVQEIERRRAEILCVAPLQALSDELDAALKLVRA